MTGSHAFKLGWESNWGNVTNSLDKNGDLDQEYQNGVPATVLVSNTPIWNINQTDNDNALFVQDTWTLNRLAMNGGIRFEWLNASVPASEIQGGRFVGFRSFSEHKDLPNWFDISPRFGLVYDVFGTGKTALKFSLNKYTDGIMSGLAEKYAPAGSVRFSVCGAWLNFATHRSVRLSSSLLNTQDGCGRLWETAFWRFSKSVWARSVRPQGRQRPCPLQCASGRREHTTPAEPQSDPRRESRTGSWRASRPATRAPTRR